jgi:hypothetical protein
MQLDELITMLERKDRTLEENAILRHLKTYRDIKDHHASVEAECVRLREKADKCK